MTKVVLATVIGLCVVAGAIVSGTFTRLEMSTEALAACSCSGPPGALGDHCCSGGKRKRCREDQTNICTWDQTNDRCDPADIRC